MSPWPPELQRDPAEPVAGRRVRVRTDDRRGPAGAPTVGQRGKRSVRRRAVRGGAQRPAPAAPRAGPRGGRLARLRPARGDVVAGGGGAPARRRRRRRLLRRLRLPGLPVLVPPARRRGRSSWPGAAGAPRPVGVPAGDGARRRPGRGVVLRYRGRRPGRGSGTTCSATPTPWMSVGGISGGPSGVPRAGPVERLAVVAGLRGRLLPGAAGARRARPAATARRAGRRHHVLDPRRRAGRGTAGLGRARRVRPAPRGADVRLRRAALAPPGPRPGVTHAGRGRRRPAGRRRPDPGLPPRRRAAR